MCTMTSLMVVVFLWDVVQLCEKPCPRLTAPLVLFHCRHPHWSLGNASEPMHQCSPSSKPGFVPLRSNALGWSCGAVGLTLDVYWSYEMVCWVFFWFCVSVFFLSIAVYKKAELAKKTEVQAHSPSRKIILKPAIKYTRPTHLSCVKRKQTGDCVLFSYAMWLANIDFFFSKSHSSSSFSIFFSSKSINLHK